MYTDRTHIQYTYFYQRIKKPKIAMFKRKQEPFHNVQIIAMFLFLMNNNNSCSEHCCSSVSEPVQSAKDTLSLAISKAFSLVVSSQKT